MAHEPSHIRYSEDREEIQYLNLGEMPIVDIVEYALEDPKDLDKYFGDVEKSVRNSTEYRRLIGYLKEFLDMNQCSFFENISGEDAGQIKIHAHHSPVTLKEVTIIVYNKRNYYKEDLELEATAKEIMYLHYMLMIGLIPLSETIHELAHSEYLFIPSNIVLGNYKEFLTQYEQFIPKEMMGKFDRIEKYTEIYSAEENQRILQKSYIFLEFEGTYKLPKLEDMKLFVEDNIHTLQTNGYNQPNPLVYFSDDEC